MKRMLVSIEKDKEFSCELSRFEINGVDASIEDFGYVCDEDVKDSEDMQCKNMKFFRHSEYSDSIKEKYGITENEVEDVIKALQKYLNIGKCNKCKKNYEVNL